jgi:type VI secretion system protein ImpF
MARHDNEIRITPSVLDRLLDYDPTMSREAPASRSKSLKDLKASVRRDLEWLLNTRSHAGHIDDGLKEVINSLATYGLPDFTAVNAQKPSEQKQLRKSIETTIRIFEPRLQDVNVTVDPIDGNKRELRFRIDARLNVRPTPEPITFDTVLLSSGQYAVQEK